MEKQKNKINHTLYARKSSEEEDRQVLSIDSQINEDKKIASSNGVIVPDDAIRKESFSAKTEYARPVFESMIKDIEAGRVQGIIAWHPNRLSRNAIDAARLISLFDKGKLKQIITAQQVFRNTPSDKFFFNLLTSQAKMENDNKSLDVKRGLRRKYEMGYPPCLSKVGYMNDESGRKGDKKWKNDTDRQPLIKKVFEEFLTARYSVRKIKEYADKNVCLRTIQRNKEGGKPLNESAMYNLLTDPFYAGFFYRNDENEEKKRYEAHESLNRLITEGQYWQVQRILGKKGKPCPTKYLESFPYKRFMKCGSCGGSVTAEQKHQLICSECKFKFSYPNKTACPKCKVKIEKMENPKYLYYIFYHCIKGKDPNCKEGALQEIKIDEYVADYFAKNIKISTALKEWCLKNFTEIIENEKQNELEVRISKERELEQKKKDYDNLVKMGSRGLISDEEAFLRLESSASADIKKAEQSLSRAGGSPTEMIDEAKKIFNFAVGVAEIFRNGVFKDKDEALTEICSNLTLKGKKVEIYEQNSYLALKKCIVESKLKNSNFEPAIYGENNEKTESFDSVRSTWLPG
ncbi:MAG: recombinase [Parcubacteria group bacterium GW2011_GWA2_33_14]|uniref:Recombinase domain-containing protein n=1 Tax=Candidatus Staskawiczbacteria bacterium RIFCSPHIGHO2_02_FULL_33_16 TaxID=1802204 RepID=A0A1G2HUC0_9BACT|nr:MAG: recombinase [Parcubacteria group bacterium GW2011_GWA2_33_14]OGZ65840.1 MAG: hypothetical protein A3D34_03260 [Candidatus Staskawiczbacteria bacterium RIFCSPHIGHO2_02_FULL_33_16]OGZ70496.1 MAG: hypothetical protein A2980_00905 [Candidatus Staskawiczbacteria bacterium RIFCSPLOWO2_01_FULL_33_13]